MIFLLAVFALAFVCGQEFGGQVKEVFTYVDTSTGSPFIGMAPPAILVPMVGVESNFTETGLIMTVANPGILLYGFQEFYFEKGEQMHFEITFKYGSQSLPNGPSADPSSGLLWFGPWWGGSVVSWLLTDLAEYAMVQLQDGTWCIPLGKRTPDETGTYTIIVDRSSLKIGFNKNQKNLLVLPGKCGIDNKFRYSTVTKNESRCEPIFTDSTFEGPARLLIWLGNFFNFMIPTAETSPFCQGCIFDQCKEDISRANRCQCEYPLVEPVPPTTVYAAQIDFIKIFSMEKTERCKHQSSSSSFVPWYQRPAQLDHVD